MTHRTPTSGPGLQISVVVPTYGRSEILKTLLAALDAQTLAKDHFELVVVDDGTVPPIEIDTGAYGYPITLLRQPNAGPGAARNLAFEHVRSPLVLILNDDAVPAPDLLAGHVEAHRKVPAKTAVLGSFPFTARSMRSPFVRLLAQTTLLFDYVRMKDRGYYGWQNFWTCNLSLPLAALREVGGFDGQTFREAICEDVELGYRLGQRGWRVHYRADLVCEHEHVVTPRGYFQRALRLGFNAARMYEKHGNVELFPMFTATAGLTPNWRASAQGTIEAYHAVQQKFVAKLESMESEPDRVLSPDELRTLADLTHKMAMIPYQRGWLLQLEGHDPGPTLENGPKTGRLTSILVVSYNALAKTRACLDALRRTADPRHPTEIIVVDNGSSDGSAEWLAQQSDITFLRNADNAGAPRARNQAIARARGDYLAFLDNDVVPTQGWLRRLLFHADVDGRSGCVGPLTNRAGHNQEIPYAGGPEIEDLELFAAERAREQERKFRYQTTMTSFCWLVRREVVDEIGGFDERFSPWGFEDDDFSMRAAMAGFRNRVALDVFVRHDHYGGKKAQVHSELLERNWSRFAEKWCGSADVAYGDYKAMQPALKREFQRAEYHVPIQPDPVSALPRSMVEAATEVGA
ncbi:MAG: glycosyltransferase family 2 protein [Planctomycetota bacterium]|nr:glycosyltransferase family 2 protein [Planctomycetota bacterium]